MSARCNAVGTANAILSAVHSRRVYGADTGIGGLVVIQLCADAQRRHVHGGNVDDERFHDDVGTRNHTTAATSDDFVARTRVSTGTV